MPARKPTVAIFTGTFDPITLGHLDIVDRARPMFDRLIVAIGENPDKQQLFPVDERLAIIRTLVKDFRNVSVEAYTGLTVNFAKKRKATAILRGLRNLSDLEYELRIALTNRKVAQVETVFIMTREEFGFTSSSMIKQIVTMGGNPKDLRALLPAIVIKRLIAYRKEKRGIFGQTPNDTHSLQT